MTLYFGNRNNRRCIAHPADDKEAFKLINKFAEERNYKIPYLRIWGDEEKTIDAGSWHEFFYLKEETTDEEEKWDKNGKGCTI